MLLNLLTSSLYITVLASKGQFYGNQELDYFDADKTRKELKLKKKEEVKNKVIVKETKDKAKPKNSELTPSEQKFWSNLLKGGAHNTAYFDEGGGYIPPIAYRVAISNPTDANVKNYYKWREKRRLEMGVFIRKLTQIERAEQFQIRRDAKKEEVVSDKILQQLKLESQNDDSYISWNDVNIIYFYSDSCPQCKNDYNNIKTIEKLGAKISYVNVNEFMPQSKGKAGSDSLHESHTKATKQMVELFNVRGTPTAHIQVGNQSAVFSGRKSFETWFKALVLLERKNSNEK